MWNRFSLFMRLQLAAGPERFRSFCVLLCDFRCPFLFCDFCSLQSGAMDVNDVTYSYTFEGLVTIIAVLFLTTAYLLTNTSRVCRKLELQDKFVRMGDHGTRIFVSQTGRKWHLSGGCGHIRNLMHVRELTPCLHCSTTGCD